MSNFAFGTYRVSDIVPTHINAIKEAIESGVQLIDTSTNYTDGGAERAIALAFRGLEDCIDDIAIVSKAGYIQGSVLKAYKESRFFHGDVVEFSDDCYHSIAPEFLHNQLSESLMRLERENIDCYLLHNPEYYLFDAIKKGVPKDERLDEIYARIEEAFVALEEEVASGRINSYGISSNSFSLPSSSDEFLPYEDLVTLAENAAKKAGKNAHSFSTIELPHNLLERGGIGCMSWAKQNSLRVLTNRPLNAMHNSMMYRLADYDEAKNYYYYLNELIEFTDNDLLKPLFNLIIELDESKHKFGWVGEWDTFLYAQVIPHMQSALKKLDEKNQQTLLQYIDIFLKEYREMVLYECSKKTKQLLKDILDGCDGSLQSCAIKYLNSIDDIDYIIVGMRKPSYVHDILGLG